MTFRYAVWIMHHRKVVLCIALLAVIAAGAGLPRISFTTDYRVYFSGENPQLRAFEKLQNTYTKNDNVLFVITPRDGNVFSRETLSALHSLADRAWQTPYSIRVDSITNFQHTSGEDDDLIVEDLVEDVSSLNDGAIERVRHIALSEPLLVNRLVSPQGDVAGVNVTVQIPELQPESETPEVVGFARHLAWQISTEYPHLDVRLTGIVMMNNAFQEAMLQDMGTLVPLMFAVVISVLALLLRSLWATFAAVMVIGMSVVTAMGLAGWLNIELSPPSASAPTIIVTLAVANCVHLLVTFLHEIRPRRGRRNAMVESLRVNLQPVFLTSLTTAIGFLSMNFSDAPPFHDLGNIVAMGVAAAFLYSITFLPALVTLMPVRGRTHHEGGHPRMVRFAAFVVAKRRTLLWGMGMIIVVLIAFVPQNELNDQFVNYFDESIEFRRDTDFAAERLTGIYTIEYSLEAEETGGISEPAFLQLLEDFSSWYRAQPEVLHVNVLTDVLKRLNMNLHADDPAYYRIPESRELAAQYLLLYEMSLPYGLDLNNQINVDKSSTRLNVTVDNLTSNQLLALEARAQSWLRENAPPGLSTDGTSPAMMFAHIGARNIRSMLLGTTVALVLISLMLVVALRSLKIGFVSMVPNLVPAAMAFGLWGIFVGQVGLALSVVTSMTLGIVVDDTVHFLSKYLRARRERAMAPEDAVRYAFVSVGTALLVTTLVLIAGFLVLAQSDFELNAGMGLLSAVVIALALVADFLFLPPLLMRIEERGHAGKS